MSMRASYTVENVLHYSIPVSNHLLNKAFIAYLFILPTTRGLFKICETLVLI